jgi:pyruvate ferredoxin oxidoreductase alpha subunit
MGSGYESAPSAERPSRTWARNLVGAIALVEGAVAQHVLTALDTTAVRAQNAFGEPVGYERSEDVAGLVRRCIELAEGGARVALIAPAAELAAARTDLATLAARRLAVVVHAVAGPGPRGAPAPLVGLAPAFALDDLPWGMLLAAGVADAIDLALVARRAAEDSGCPFFVVHEQREASDFEPVTAPLPELCEAFVGPSAGRVRRASHPPGGPAISPGAADRAFAERVPFALSSAMRELETLTGRHHDVIERAPAADTAVVLVGAGAMGDSLLREVSRLRAHGHDVAAVRVVAWRPFPAPRLVKALGRALAVTIMERVDRPFASGAPLAVQLKAAFADAMTWAPDYPGVGRIPRMVSGYVEPDRDVDSTDLDAIVHNVLANERGKRAFVLGGDDARALSTPAWAPPAAREPGHVFAMRGVAARREVAVAAAELCAAVLASALGVRTRGVVRGLAGEEGEGIAFDLIASRHRPRGGHAPHAVDVVAVDDPAILGKGNVLTRLAPGGWLAIPTEQRAAESFWAEVPPWVKATAFDRAARVIGWFPTVEEDPWVTAAAFAGIALAALADDPPPPPSGHEPSGQDNRRGALWNSTAADGTVVAREVAAALLTVLEGVVATEKTAAIAARGGSAARAAFERHVEVPRAAIDREDDGVRIGRRDARVSRPPT